MKRFAIALVLLLSGAWITPVAVLGAPGAAITIDSQMIPPSWALMERELLKANTEACEEFFARYFDERGYLMCVERWGGDDGPDDAIENCTDWPLLHALGADDVVLHMYKKAWEGHLRQYTEAKTVEVPFARDGMYFKEFPVMFDWQHNSEGLTVFNMQALSDPYDDKFIKRAQRYSGFYMDEDPGAPNYDPKHKIVRSMINGSRGPMLRKATALDWTGDRIEVINRFDLRHSERNYTEMLEHFKDYNDVPGDHPLNLLITNVVINAYMATGEEKYKKWVMEYIDAWHDRMVTNGNIIPSNIGLDGTIGGECGGRWYGGTYGWSFSPIVPQSNKITHRNRQHWGFSGFMNAYLLSGGDDRYLDVWRKQAKAVNAQGKMIDGQMQYPRMHGDEGWYGFQPSKYNYNALEIYHLSMRADDREHVGPEPWLEYLEGNNPSYPEEALGADFLNVRKHVAGFRSDTTTPDTRLADDPLRHNPASVQSLTRLMVGGLLGGRRANILYSRLRYFDPVTRRAGIPEDIAALVSQMTADETTVTLVNVSQLKTRTVVVQAGSYAQHEFLEVTVGGETMAVNSPCINVRLLPGAGAELKLKLRRFAHQPTTTFPWDRRWK